MPPVRKPAEKRQNRSTKDLVLPSSPGEVPVMPKGLCAAAQSSWRSYWSDVVAGSVRPADESLVMRL